jgi:DUF2075 family protein/predicted GIY-YIG superfamily endonuclease/SOS-response transcriptional repressor LexA
MSDNYLVEVNRFGFSADSIEDVRRNALASNHWPVVYVLSSGDSDLAYVGETTDALTRMSAHLKNADKARLNILHLICSERFNKSATLDIESSLIKYLAADGKYSLLNGNLGLVDHNYFQKDEVYAQIFKNIWNKLLAEGVARHSLNSIDNSDLFKYSPYKSLSPDQRQGLIGILNALQDDKIKDVIIRGGAGTGKSILAIYLFKLLYSDSVETKFREFSGEEAEICTLVDKIKSRFRNLKMALVVPMSSFRGTLKKAFKEIPGLKPSMVIAPAELAKQQYDIVLVDESHRLRRRVNLGAYFGAFDRACDSLGFDKYTSSELDWVRKQSTKSLFFYDENQVIKPSDTSADDFSVLMSKSSTQTHLLMSQFRARGGNSYVEFLDSLFNMKLGPGKKYFSKNYELNVFDSLDLMVSAIRKKNAACGLSRLIAGYSWPWISKNDNSLYDIEIDGTKLRWNTTNTDWINSAHAIDEVGCIHTTQGYDLNYAGIIFGEEISFDRDQNAIVIDKSKYHDRNGRQGITDSEELKKYILNIYRTIMLRGIRGTFVYACDKELRDYLAEHIPMHASSAEIKKENTVELKPFVNSVPFYDLKVAAGDFSSLQAAEHKEWVAVPDDVIVSENLFACRVVGESMNRIIPNNSVALFRFERGGSRNGKIVLVEHSTVIDGDSGSHYTVKEYQSFKLEDVGGWHNQKILLKPRSYDESFEPIELTEDQSSHYRVVGEFVRVLDD